MAFVIKDRVRETTTTTGTSAISLGGTSTSFESFSDHMSNADTTHYAIVHSTADEWEVGLGTWNTGNTLTRTTVLSSSNSNAAVNFTSGSKDVFMTYPASQSVSNLPLSGGTLTGDLSLGDNDKAIFGDGDDLQIYHTGSTSYIDEQGTGGLVMRGTNLFLRNSANENYLGAIADGSVTIYYDNSEKLATTSTGIDVTGNATFADNDKAIFGAGNDLQIYHDETASYVSEQGAGPLNVLASQLNIYNATETSKLAQFNSTSSKLFHNNSEKLSTTSTGIDVTGNLSLGDNDKAIFGAGSDLQIYHDGSNNYISGTGNSGSIFIEGSGWTVLKGATSGQWGVGSLDGAQVNLYYGGNAKLSTTSTGINVLGNITVSGTVDGRDIATNIPASLGTAGQVLTVNSGATATEWADASGGGGGGITTGKAIAMAMVFG